MELTLKPQKITRPLLEELERKNLIQLLRVPESLEKDKQKDGVDTLYATAPEYGTHKLICVRKNQTQIQITTHPDKEEVVLLNNTGRIFKPLYMIIALFKEDVLESKAAQGDLSDHDFWALELEFNNPETCYFTVLEKTPHCEITRAGEGEAPLFFVTEPTDLTMGYTNLGGTTVKLAL